MSSELAAPQDPSPSPPPPPPPPPPPATTTPPLDPKSDTTPPPPPSSEFKKPSPAEPLIVTIPSYSRWFRWDGIDECEVRHVPEFFDGKSQNKNPSVYKYLRNSIINKYRANPSKKITFTEARRTLVGDVGSIRRIFDFLDTWGLVNYFSPSSSKPPLKWDDKDTKSSSSSTPMDTPTPPPNNNAVALADKSNKYCCGCKALCTIACFVSDKYDLVLCARCYVRGNYRVGVSSNEFRRVEISEPVRTDWTDKETLNLLEAIMHYGDNWKRVAEHVGGRTEKECVARFIKLPFGEQFVEPADQCVEDSTETKGHVNAESESEPPAKRRNITSLADASNPIMAQAAFLSALAGVEVSEAAAQAAVATLYNVHRLARKGNVQTQAPAREQELEKVSAEAEPLLRQEEDEVVNSISTITEVQMKEIVDKIIQFEQTELQLEREWHQVHEMRHQLFLDQLTLLFHKAATPKVENVALDNVFWSIGS